MRHRKIRLYQSAFFGKNLFTDLAKFHSSYTPPTVKYVHSSFFQVLIHLAVYFCFLEILKTDFTANLGNVPFTLQTIIFLHANLRGLKSLDSFHMRALLCI